MEPSSHQLEEDEGQDESEQEDYYAANQLDAHETEITRRQQPLLIVHKAKCYDAPETAKQVRLGRL